MELPYSRVLQRIVTLLNLGILALEFMDLFFNTPLIPNSTLRNVRRSL